MEQEPVYVPANRLADVCGDVLGRIYGIRQDHKEAYVKDRVAAYNHDVLRTNRWRKYARWFGVKPQMMITPYGMEMMLITEVQAVGAEHPMCVIHQQYGGLEHEAKDVLVQCKLNETVSISGNMVRGMSHLGVDLGFMLRPRFGFYPR